VDLRGHRRRRGLSPLRRLGENHRRQEEKHRANQKGAIHGSSDPFGFWTFYLNPFRGFLRQTQYTSFLPYYWGTERSGMSRLAATTRTRA